MPRIRPTPIPAPTPLPSPAAQKPLPGSPENIPEPTPVLRPGTRETGSEPKPHETSQVAPSVPPSPGRSKGPYIFNTGSSADREAEELAAEVAAILAEDQGEVQSEPARSQAPRPLIVKLPSEKYLTEATKELQSLPMDERPVAFQAMIEKYRAMRSAERESMRKR